MLALIIYELRSHWIAICFLCSVLFAWDILLFFSFNQLALLYHTLLFITWIGFSVLYVVINAFTFSNDLINRNVYLLTLTPQKTWKIILSKLIPIWFVYFILGFLHSFFMFFAYLSNSINTNIDILISKYFLQLFSFHVVLFLLTTLSLLLLWIINLQIRILLQSITNMIWFLTLILLAIGCILIVILHNLLITGLSDQNTLGLAFVSFPYTLMIILLTLSVLLFWILWLLWHQYTDS